MISTFKSVHWKRAGFRFPTCLKQARHPKALYGHVWSVVNPSSEIWIIPSLASSSWRVFNVMKRWICWGRLTTDTTPKSGDRCPRNLSEVTIKCWMRRLLPSKVPQSSMDHTAHRRQGWLHCLRKTVTETCSLSVSGNIAESINNQVLCGHLENYNRTEQSQHGFMKGKLCLTNLLIFKILESVGKRGVIF